MATRRGPPQRTLFDAIASARGKEDGIALAAGAKSRREVLALAQQLARRIALSRESRETHMDDVQAALIGRGYTPADLGNAAGAVFRERCWRFTGRWTKSERVSSHRNDLRIWRYAGDE